MVISRGRGVSDKRGVDEARKGVDLHVSLGVVVF